MNSPLAYSLALCAISATLEGILAGRGVQARFADLRLPRYSPPLPVWFVIGGIFYVVCFSVLYRLFSLPGSGLRDAALVLLVGMMLMNALWNYVFFRARNLFLSFVTCLPYGLVAVVLFVLMLKLDRLAALVLSPYILYLGYAIAWGYALWKRNPGEEVAV
ncbi:MAG TPA: TspO/MBR family protein [Gemmatimonadota bacterium]|nr:TspO/MBR family protein [Gemmatimonadota bacterium]